MLCYNAIFVKFVQFQVPVQKCQEKWQMSLFVTLLFISLVFCLLRQSKGKKNYQLVTCSPLNRRKVPELLIYQLIAFLYLGEGQM